MPVARFLPKTIKANSSLDSWKKSFKEKAARCFKTGTCRTPTQDIEFAIDQLVEVALIALSPGINRTFTALMCVDMITDAMVYLIQRDEPDYVLIDEQRHPRVFLHNVRITHALDAAYSFIRQNSANNMAVSIRLVESLTVIVQNTISLYILDKLASIVADIREGLLADDLACHRQFDYESFHKTHLAFEKTVYIRRQLLA